MGLLGHIPQDVLNIFLAEAADLLGQWDEACYALEKGQDTREALLWVMRTAQNLRRASRGVGLDEFAQALASTEELIRELLKSDVQPHRTVLDTLLLAYSTLSRWLAGVRTDPDYVEDITSLSDAVRICRSGLQRTIAEAQSMTPSGAEVRLAGTPFAQGNNTQDQRGVSGVPQMRIEEIIESVGHLVMQHGVLAHLGQRNEYGSTEFIKALEASFRLSSELQHKAVSLRMLPLAKLFERIEDYVLDLSEERHVALQFDSEGKEVELDSALLDELWKPLSVLIEMAFDLDFDSPEERVRAGKLPSLVVRLVASAENGFVHILIEDDGRGVSENDTSLSADELKSRLEKIRGLLCPIAGTLKVVAHKDKSTAYQIMIPESLRLMEVVLTQCQGQAFALPTHVIDEIIEPGQFHTHIIRGDKQFIEYNTRIYPYVTLLELLERTTQTQRPRVQASLAIERGHVILLRCGRDVIALGVDSIRTKQKTVIHPLSVHLQNVRGLAGTLMMDDGEPVLVVDIVEITDAFWAPRSEREAA